MTLPNKLTILRILLIPIMIILYYITPLQEIEVINTLSLANLLACLVFIIASLTDFLDGHIARKNNLVTTFGKFADPLADKILVMAAMILLMDQTINPNYAIEPWIIIVILSREFIVSGIRLVAVENGKVIAASKLGKYKTASTMIALIVVFLENMISGMEVVGMILIYIALALTIISGIDYFWKNKNIILESI